MLVLLLLAGAAVSSALATAARHPATLPRPSTAPRSLEVGLGVVPELDEAVAEGVGHRLVALIVGEVLSVWWWWWLCTRVRMRAAKLRQQASCFGWLRCNTGDATDAAHTLTHPLKLALTWRVRASVYSTCAAMSCWMVSTSFSLYLSVCVVWGGVAHVICTVFNSQLPTAASNRCYPTPHSTAALLHPKAD